MRIVGIVFTALIIAAAACTGLRADDVKPAPKPDDVKPAPPKPDDVKPDDKKTDDKKTEEAPPPKPVNVPGYLRIIVPAIRRPGRDQVLFACS